MRRRVATQVGRPALTARARGGQKADHQEWAIREGFPKEVGMSSAFRMEGM